MEERRRRCAKLMLCASRRRSNTLAMSCRATTEQLVVALSALGATSLIHRKPRSHAPSTVSLIPSPPPPHPTSRPLVTPIPADAMHARRRRGVMEDATTPHATRKTQGYHDRAVVLLNPITTHHDEQIRAETHMSFLDRGPQVVPQNLPDEQRDHDQTSPR